MDDSEYMVVAKTLAANGGAAQILAAAGISCAEAGEPVGVSAPTIWRWTHGQREPHGAAAARFGKLLVRTARLIGWGAESQ